MNKLKQKEFTLASLTDLTSSSSSPVVATFSCVDEVTELRFQESESADSFSFDLSSAQVTFDLLSVIFFFFFLISSLELFYV